MNKKFGIYLWYAVGALFALFLFQYWQAAQLVETVPYSELQSLLKDGKVSNVDVGATTVRATLAAPLPDGRTIVQATRVDPALAEELTRYNVAFSGVLESNLLGAILSWIVPVAFFLAVWFFAARRMAGQQGLGGLMTIGKSKAKVAVEHDIDVTFDDVAGVDEAKAELKEVIAFLKNPKGYGRLGAHVPKGILLVGPPGTGKTLLARAVAGEASVPFFSINGSEFVELFVGLGAARVRDLFEQARKSAPCIIFIDELDALGRARGLLPVSGGADEKEQTLNQLLAELDGFDPSTGVVLLAATNRPEILDPALLRAGRFDRQILVDRPDKMGRIQILTVHMRKIRVGDDVKIEQLAALTPGFSGADLANLVNEAAILATRRSGDAVTMDDFTAAIERIVAGLEKKSRVLNPRERRVIAYHESGHALVTLALPNTDTVHKVSIIPRGIGALGYNIQRPTEDRYLMTAEELKIKMACLLGGRAAEILVFQQPSTGAADDLDKVTDIARGMVMRYGMAEQVGQVVYAPRQSPFVPLNLPMHTEERLSYSESTATQIDDAVRGLVAAAFDRALTVLRRHRSRLDSIAEKLLVQETLTANELPSPQDLGVEDAQAEGRRSAAEKS